MSTCAVCGKQMDCESVKTRIAAMDLTMRTASDPAKGDAS
jgi:hypothetical protein